MGVIKIRIGDTMFYTTESTLNKIPFFKTMLDSDINFDKDQDGNIFIDRNGKYFFYILEFARECLISSVLELLSIQELLVLSIEVQFYGLDKFYKDIETLLTIEDNPVKVYTFRIENIGRKVNHYKCHRDEESLYVIYDKDTEIYSFESQYSIDRIYLDIHDYIDKLWDYLYQIKIFTKNQGRVSIYKKMKKNC